MMTQVSHGTENKDKRAVEVDPYFGISPKSVPCPSENPITAVKTEFPSSIHDLFRKQPKWDPDAAPFEPAVRVARQRSSGAKLMEPFEPSKMPFRQASGAGDQLKENVPTYSHNSYTGPSSTNSRMPSTSTSIDHSSAGYQAPTTAAHGSQTKSIHMDDPFTEKVGHTYVRTPQGNMQPPGHLQGSQYRAPSSQSHSQYSLPQSTTQQHQQIQPPVLQNPFMGQQHTLPTVQGAMDFSFRFPPSFQPAMNARSPSSHVKPNKDVKPTAVPAVPKKVDKSPSAKPYQRDPKPYTSFSTTSKKEMLLQNLEEMVKVSEAQGNLPSSTRTVLYDPVARQADNQSRMSFQTYAGQSESGKEVLKLRCVSRWSV